MKEPGLARFESKIPSYPWPLTVKDSQRKKWLQGKDQIQGVSARPFVKTREDLRWPLIDHFRQTNIWLRMSEAHLAELLY